MKQLFILFALCFSLLQLSAQNVGIGTSTPEAKLHINGTLKLQKGVVVNNISSDSSLAPGSDSILPTQRAIKNYVEKGLWADRPDSALAFKDSVQTGLSEPSDVFIKGNYAYVVSKAGNRLSIFDISNPSAISPRGSIQTNLASPTSVFVQGNMAYVTNGFTSTLSSYDVSNPNLIVAKATISNNLLLPLSVFVNGDYAYVASYGNNRLVIFNISNPDNFIALPGIAMGTGISPTAVFIQNNYAYITSDYQLIVYEVINPNNPIEKDGISTNIVLAKDVFVQDNYAYVISKLNSRVCVFNIANPLNIVATSYTNTNLDQPTALYVQGAKLWVASTGNNKLCLFDCSNPASLQFVESTSTNLAGPSSVFVQNNYAWVTSSTNNSLGGFTRMLPTAQRNLVMDTLGNLQLKPVQWVEQGINLSRLSGNVGIGTSLPMATLHLNGNQKIDSAYTLEFGAGIASKESSAGKIGYEVFTPGALDMVGAGSSVASRKIKFWSEGGTEFNGNVGIGTAATANRLEVAGNLSMSGSIINEAWKTPTLLQGWVNFGGIYANAGYFKDKEGMVHMQGLIKNGVVAGNSYIISLPIGYRPSATLVFALNNAGVMIDAYIDASGDIRIYPANNTWISLSNISFRAQ